MDQATTRRPVDPIQERIAQYSSAFRFDAMSARDVHATKVRVIDTIGSLLGGFDGPPSRIARTTATHFRSDSGATILGTVEKATPDVAAFVNGTAARYVEMNDIYFARAFFGGHPSDVVMPVLAAAEQADASGRDLLAGVALAYEIYSRVGDATKIPGFDQTNFVSMASAMGAGKMMGLSHAQLYEALSMAVVPNNALQQSRTGHLTMWKAVAAGQAARAGVFAAMLARDGMEGANLPFVGEAAWCKHVAGNAFTMGPMGNEGDEPLRIHESVIKMHPACGMTLSSIMATEKIVAQVPDRAAIERITVETFEGARQLCGIGEHCWNPLDRETADHSIPYVVAATLMHGTITAHQFDDDYLWDPELRALLGKVDVVVLDEFTRAFDQRPSRQQTRVRIRKRNGSEVIGESGGELGDLNNPRSDQEIEAKFRNLASPVLADGQVRTALDLLWKVDTVSDVAVIARAIRFT